jgi:hypothetical protein
MGLFLDRYLLTQQFQQPAIVWEPASVLKGEPASVLCLKMLKFCSLYIFQASHLIQLNIEEFFVDINFECKL